MSGFAKQPRKEQLKGLTQLAHSHGLWFSEDLLEMCKGQGGDMTYIIYDEQSQGYIEQLPDGMLYYNHK